MAMLTVTLPISVIKAALECVSKDETHYNLCGVYVEATQGHTKATSTDDHTLYHWSQELPDGVGRQEHLCGSAILPTEYLKKVLSVVDKHETDVIFKILPSELVHEVDVVHSSVGIVGKVVDGKYPDYPWAFPGYTENTQEPVAFGPAYLARLARISKHLEGKNKIPSVQFAKLHESSACLVKFKGSPESLFVIMPMRWN